MLHNVTEIVITRFEGPNGGPRHFTGSRCWLDAETWLIGASRTAPRDGFDQCRVAITFAEVDAAPRKLELRYDLTHFSEPTYHTLARTVDDVVRRATSLIPRISA